MLQKKSISATLLFIIITAGICIRIIGIQHREVYGDESIYYNTAVSSSTKDLISIKHKFKDHGILYFLLVKTQHIVTKDILSLRYTNIVLYVVSTVILYLILQRLELNIASLFGALLYTFHWHFIQLSTMLSPYNLVIPMSFLSILLLLNIIKQKSSDIRTHLLFALITSLCMYADYSFFYLFYFYLSVFLFHLLIERKTNLIQPYVFTFIFTLPGIIQFVFNFEHITILFERVPGTVKHTFVEFLADLGRIIMFLPTDWIGTILMIGVTICLVIFAQIKKIQGISLLGLKSILCTLIISVLTLFIVHQHIFPLYIPRSFWVFHFLVIVVLTYFVKYAKYKIITHMGILFIFAANILGFRLDSYTIPHYIGEQIKYSSLLHAMSSRRAPSSIVLYDPYFACEALVSYYFSPNYPSSDKLNAIVKKIISKQPAIIRLRHNNNLDTLFKPWSKDDSTTIVLCDEIHKKPNFIGEAYTMYNNSFKRL